MLAYFDHPRLQNRRRRGADGRAVGGGGGGVVVRGVVGEVVVPGSVIVGAIDDVLRDRGGVEGVWVAAVPSVCRAVNVVGNGVAVSPPNFRSWELPKV